MSVEVEFSLIAERGILEGQAMLLCESIRAFAGRHANAQISVISPRSASRPSVTARARFALLDATYVELDLDSPVPEYGTSYRVLALGWRARQPGPPVLVQLDSDTVFVAEPDLLVGDDIAVARPVDVVGMCTARLHDPRHALWDAMCRVNGVALDELPRVRTTVDGISVRASFNGGLIAGRRELFIEVENCFRRIVDAGLCSCAEPASGMRIGAGRVTAKGFSMWGTGQAAIAIAAAKLKGSVRMLDDGHNVPLHLLRRLHRVPTQPIHLHYHWLFNDRRDVDDVFRGKLPLTPVQRAWLATRLPLALRTAEPGGVFNHPRPPAPRQRASGNHPACSVVMTAYNAERFLREAVDSVLRQDFRDLELIIVDDASDEPETCKVFEKLDARVRVLTNPLNVGTAAAANRGIDAARSDIIIRLDSDDVAERHRVGCLLDALHADSELGLVGSAVLLVDEAGRPLRVQPMPEGDFEIRWTILFHCPFYHSAVAFRRSFFEAAGGYRPQERISADHYLWYDMLPFCRTRNLNEPLTRYRVRRDGLTASHRLGNPRERTRPIREALWREIGLTYCLQEGQVALDVSAMLRGQQVSGSKRRAAAAEVIQVAFARVFALRCDFMRDTEHSAVDRFAKTLRAHLSERRAHPRQRVCRAWQRVRSRP